MVTFNGENIVKSRFPNNEVDYVNICTSTEENKERWDVFELIYESNEDLFNLLVMKKRWDDVGWNFRKEKCCLKIKYFPYCQMDREMPTHLFSLKYVAQIINELKFDNVLVYDPHSNVLPALINHCEVCYPMTKCKFDNYNLLFYPDNGAAKKYSELIDMPYRFGNKKRNLDTGEIVCYEVIADKVDIEGKRILIVDDMVMGGRTFVEAAKALREMGAAQVDLYVTHLKPEARNFYNFKGNSLIDNIYSADTLEVIPIFNTPEPRP